jgi:hypothetical protein
VTVSLGFYADHSTTIDLHEFDAERAPLLDLGNPGQYLTIGAFDSVPIADHLAFARKLADATAGYLSALERFAAAQSADLTKAA